MSQTTLAEIGRQKNAPAAIAVGMETVSGFEAMQRIAKLFASSAIVPKAYQGEENLANAFIAVDMALRMGANPLMVMQNLYIVHGNPAWSAQFLIATFNKSGRFSAIRYEFEGKENTDAWGCRAVTTELATKEKLAGPLITIGMAKKEGWYNKAGSKWQSMPEQMLRYRAAAWLVRAYAPEIAMGLHTADEMEDATITVDAVTLESLKPGGQTPSEAPDSPVEIEEQPQDMPEPENRIDCPSKEMWVSPEDCERCKMRPGCPAWEENF